MEYQVTVQINGEDIVAGSLFQNVRHGTETASFSYAPSYVSNSSAFSLAPDMPLGNGSFHSSGLKDFRAFEDCMPDRWGRNLLKRAERINAREQNRAPRMLFEADMLVGVSDETRQGAIRIWDAAGKRVLSDSAEGVPREVRIPDLLTAADIAAEDLEADVRDLIAAGSSLGGARPKASVRDESGTLCIAKFPKANEGAKNDVCAWEQVALLLMGACGIDVPRSRLLRIKNRSVLLLERFDRQGAGRIPYISGLTAVQGYDGERYSYLELVEFVEEQSAQPTRDLHELWKRMVFTCAVGNTDNHMRNQGFLRSNEGWVLSPCFDVNPTQGSHKKFLATSVDFDDDECDPRLAMAVRDYFRLTESQATEIAAQVRSALLGWKVVARRCGIDDSSIASMASSFEQGIDRLGKMCR